MLLWSKWEILWLSFKDKETKNSTWRHDLDQLLRYSEWHRSHFLTDSSCSHGDSTSGSVLALFRFFRNYCLFLCVFNIHMIIYLMSTSWGEKISWACLAICRGGKDICEFNLFSELKWFSCASKSQTHLCVCTPAQTDWLSLVICLIFGPSSDPCETLFMIQLYENPWPWTIDLNSLTVQGSVFPKLCFLLVSEWSCLSL